MGDDGKKIKLGGRYYCRVCGLEVVCTGTGSDKECPAEPLMHCGEVMKIKPARVLRCYGDVDNGCLRCEEEL